LVVGQLDFVTIGHLHGGCVGCVDVEARD